jgi:pimeloyl-ACP methyl ester carboxylesterase
VEDGRVEITFDSHGERCAAWLYGQDLPRPSACVVLAHGFGATRAARLGAYAERFAAAGIRALAFDYRHFGGSGGQPRQLLSTGRQLDDWRAALAFARSLDGVDPDRVAAWGSSYGGGHVARIASEDRRLAAAISQGPFLDGIWALRAAGPRALVRMTAAGLRDGAAAMTGRDPYNIPIVAPPGELAGMSQPGADAGYRAMFDPGDEFVNEFSARALLTVGLYRPVMRARRIGCPWLVQVCIRDDVTPPQPAIEAARRAPRAELRAYDAGHWDLYRGPLFDRAVAEQVDFLRRHLA